jgi:hypothetical protein
MMLDIELKRVNAEDKEILRNLLEKYDYEFSQWNNVISEYTKGNYRLIESYPNSEYDDGTLRDLFFFEN